MKGILPQVAVLREIDAAKPRTSALLLTRAERYRHVERAILGLYRWYVSHSQRTRNWNPDRDFDWRQFQSNHSETVVSIIQGFFAVEQFTPDYVTTILRLVRRRKSTPICGEMHSWQQASGAWRGSRIIWTSCAARSGCSRSRIR